MANVAETTLREIPQSPAAEAALLGSMMLDETCVDDVMEILSAEDFYRDEHRLIFEAIQTARRKAPGHVNGVIVRQKLEDTGQMEAIGGLEYLRRVIESVPGPSAWASYAQTVREKSARRKVIAEAGKMLNMAYGTEPLETITGTAGEALSQICDLDQQRSEPTTIFDALSAAYASIDREARYALDAGPVLSELIRGFVGGQMVVIAARPSHGKTSLALHLCMEGLRHRESTSGLFVSFEMEVEDMAKRMLSYESRVPYERMDKQFLSKDDYGKIVDVMGYLNERYDIRFQTGNGNPYSVAAAARKLHRKKPLSFVVVDYIQRMYCPGKWGSRNDEISRVSNLLKNLALELNVPVIVLSQLNRGVESREDKHPRMSDLRESGTIEQDADIILGVVRPQVYDHKLLDDTMDIEVLKHRNGKCGMMSAMFDGPCMRVFRVAQENERWTEPAEQSA